MAPTATLKIDAWTNYQQSEEDPVKLYGSFTRDGGNEIKFNLVGKSGATQFYDLLRQHSTSFEECWPELKPLVQWFNDGNGVQCKWSRTSVKYGHPVNEETYAKNKDEALNWFQQKLAGD